MTIKLLNFLFIFIVLGIYFILISYENKLSPKQKNRIIILSIIILSIFAGVREIGTDLLSYKRIFDTVPIIKDFSYYIKNMFTFRVEPGFFLLISITKQLSFTFNFFLMISAFIPLSIVYRIIKKSDESNLILLYTLFLMLYLLRGPLDIIRHFFAATLYLWALYSLARGERLKYYFKVFTSYFFHYSSVALFFIGPLLNKTWKVSNYFFSIIIVAFAGIGMRGFIIESAHGIQSNSPMINKLQSYLTNQYEYLSIFHFVLRNLMENYLSILNIIIIFIALQSKHSRNEKNIAKLSLNSMILGTLLYVFFISFGAYTMAFRLNFLFGIGSFFVLKDVLINLIKNKNYIAYFLWFLILLCYNLIVAIYYSGLGWLL